MAGRGLKAELYARVSRVGQEPFLVGPVRPCARDDPCAALWPDIVPVRFNPGVDRGAVEKPLLDEKAFESFRSERRLGR